MDTKIETDEQDGKYVITMTARITPKDHAGFHNAMTFAALALTSSQPVPEEDDPENPSVESLKSENAALQAKLDALYEQIAALTFEKQRLQSQIIGGR